jgi:DNA-binding GntR family transcriptional regulator
MELPALPKPSSRTDLVVDAMRDAILKGDLPQGHPLVEREIAARLNVSKTPVREALKILSRSGLVDTSSYRGVIVRRVDGPMVKSAYEVRLLLEPAALQGSVGRMTDADIMQVRMLLERAAESARRDELVEMGRLNRQFHRDLCSHCDNPLLIDILDNLQDQVALIALTGWAQDPSWDSEANQHRAILEEVEKRDGEAAAAILSDHISGSLTRVLRALAAAKSG